MKKTQRLQLSTNIIANEYIHEFHANTLQKLQMKKAKAKYELEIIRRQ